MDDVNGKRPRSPRVKPSAPSRRDFRLPFFLRTASKTLGKKTYLGDSESVKKEQMY